MSARPNLGMTVTTFENPMGINGFEFVEFAAPADRADATLFGRADAASPSADPSRLTKASSSEASPVRASNSAPVPTARTRPWPRMTMRSQRRCASSM